jgi:hypothetical protein
MDDVRFDRLARVLGNGTTRRGVLGALAAFAGLELSASAKRRRAAGKPEGPKRPDKPKKPSKPDKPTTPAKVLVCHKPGTAAQQTLSIASPAVAAHLRHGDHLGACCPADHVFCNGHCCPPPPQGGKAMCCPDGSCGCAGTCCKDDCFYEFAHDTNGGERLVGELCCAGSGRHVCLTGEKSEKCCPIDSAKDAGICECETCCTQSDCSCIGQGGIAGSYRRR